tara:strand:+ start:203 stop:355 length:153 start_codon:yes stop_codon:yes gene_type:complete
MVCQIREDKSSATCAENNEAEWGRKMSQAGRNNVLHLSRSFNEEVLDEQG